MILVGKTGSRSGQVMVEACIGLALLIFIWIAASFAMYMGTNRIRTAMAARHAAWLKGSGKTPTVELIESNFFFEGGVTRIETGEGEGIASLLSGGDQTTYGEAGRGPFKAKVTFGITPADVNSTTVFPFVLMRTQLPMMPPSLMEGFLSVESECQWDEVGDTWSEWADALRGVWNAVKSEIVGIFGL